jgi:hypothetical protein
VVALWPLGQRSVMNMVATALTVASTCIFGIFVIGEGLAGA